MKLQSLVGSTVRMLIPRLHAVKHQDVKLLGVEVGGLWIENQGITNAILQAAGVATGPRTPIFFLPWHEIATIFHYLPQQALDEKAFGV